jgi:hypothetical protein
VIAGCEHGAGSHDGTEPSMASAPDASRAWLLIEHPAEATAAIRAYHGQVTPERHRGRVGQPRPAQQEEHDLPTRAGSLAVAALA